MDESGIAEHLKYIILPGKMKRASAGYDLYCETYQFWKMFWLSEMARSGGDRKYVNADDFLRQSEILVVLHRDQIVSMVLSSLYDLASPACRDAKYFEALDESMFRRITKTGSIANTIEFLMVNPDWRAGRAGAPMGAVMIGLALCRAKALNVNVSVGMPRVDNRVHLTSYDFGATTLGSFVKVNIACEVVAFYPELITPHSRTEVNEMIRGLDRKTINYCEQESDAPSVAA